MDYFPGEDQIIVRVDFNNNQTEMVKTEFGKNIFIQTSFPELFNLFQSYPSIIQNSGKTIFLFENSSWEIIKIIFLSLRIRLSGDSPSKRFLFSPLELRLVDVAERMKKFWYHQKVYPG